MSQPNCDACTNLREYAPMFTAYGISDDIAASLRNNTGLNSQLPVLHTNCEDLNDLNDCLIGRLGQEIESHDVCDWKEYMSKMVPNLYELLKAMIAGDCGQWDKIGDLCVLLQQQMQQNVDAYGILEGTKLRPHAERWGGEIMTKNGIKAAEIQGMGDFFGFGIGYLKMNVRDCSGTYRVYEWIQPRILGYKLGSNVDYDDVLWRVDLTKARNWGFTEHLIYTLREYPQWWQGFGNSRGLQKLGTMKLSVEGDYLNLTLVGSNAPMAGVTIDSSSAYPYLFVS